MPTERYSFPHKHLLGIEPLSARDITALLDQARAFEEVCERPDIKIVPALRKKLVVNLFFENSTRTRNSFEIAEKRLSAEIINFDADTSSLNKGETLVDTALNLEAMHPDLIVMRHSAPGAHALLARHMKASIVNAGDGAHEHPTQALLDAYTLRKKLGQLQGLRVAIVGDIRNSRVVRSNLWLLTKMGAKVTLVGPPTLVPREMQATWPSVDISHDLDAILPQQDVVMMLRAQFERGTGAYIPGQGEYSRYYQLNRERMARARKDVVVLHPGPINRGLEITSEVADGPNNLILDQVTNGVPVRMAVLYLLSHPHGGAGSVMALPAERILHAILVLRGERVLLDSDLAGLYGVETRVLVQAVKRNAERFPGDFLFQLTSQEWADLKSQSVISRSWGGRRTEPYAFTELGVAMLSSILNSERAIQANIAGTTPISGSANALPSHALPSGGRGWGPVMRAFTQLRGMLAAHSDLAHKLATLEKKYDGQFRVVFQALQDLMEPPLSPKKPIGFRPKK